MQLWNLSLTRQFITDSNSVWVPSENVKDLVWIVDSNCLPIGMKLRRNEVAHSRFESVLVFIWCKLKIERIWSLSRFSWFHTGFHLTMEVIWSEAARSRFYLVCYWILIENDKDLVCGQFIADPSWFPIGFKPELRHLVIYSNRFLSEI